NLGSQSFKRRGVFECIEARSFTSLECHMLTESVRHHQNIGKHNCSVKAKTANRLQRNFRGEFWIKTQVKKIIRLLADCPIFRKISPRLSHQPNWRNRTV